eukprot:14206670-Alexandrium_andersonii.AAC.1
MGGGLRCFADSEPLRGLLDPLGELGPLPPKEGLGQTCLLRLEGPVNMWSLRPVNSAAPPAI